MHRHLALSYVALEKDGAEVAECLMTDLMDFLLYAKINCDDVDQDAMHYVTYPVPTASASATNDDNSSNNSCSARLVKCRVASAFNEVGLKLWEAAWFLAEFCIAYKELFAGQSVLELGAGVGFTGLVLAKCAFPKRILLTDYAPDVMKNLRHNVAINAKNRDDTNCVVDVATLDWDDYGGHMELQDEGAFSPDVLLAGDCAYDVAAFPALMNVLKCFLHDEKAARAKQPPRVAFFAATIRNQATFQTFLDQLHGSNIAYDDMTAAALAKMGRPLYQYDNRDQIRLCRLYSNSTSST